jgi:type II secretory pathway pseudopilin PulG
MADSAGHDQANVLEVPVTIQGAKHVEGSEQRQIFTETTKTTIVFGNGAVVNLSSKVTQGQCVFLRNDRTGREILCKVLEWRQVAESGYADLEFTTRDPNFWDAPVMQEPAVAAPVIPAPVVTAPVVTAPAPKPVEAQEKVLGVSDPTPDAAPVAQRSAPASEETPGVSAATAAAAEAAAGERAARLTEMLEEPAESEAEAAQNDTKDAELLAALIAKDPKRKPKREAATAEAKESEFDAMSEDAPEQREASAHAEDDSDADGEGGGKAKLIAMLRPVAHRLHKYTYGKGAIQAGIAALVTLVLFLGFAWHSHRVKTRSNKQAVAAALAQAKQDARAQSAATPSSSSGAVEAPAHGNNSGATPAQAAQKIQQQAAALGAGAANVSNATAASVPASVPSSVPSGVPSVASASAPPVAPSVASKLQVRKSAPETELDASGQPKLRHTKAPNGGETIPARIVAQPPPAIPPWAKGLDTDGVVKVDALIDEKGNLRSTKALSGPRVLQHAAERAVALWIFEPALTDGKPTATHMVLTVQFQR